MIATKEKSWIEISKRNLLQNLGEFKKRAKQTSAIMAVVKANAYGHGLEEVASILKSHKDVMLGVDSLEEAFTARSAARNEIMILGYIPQEKIALAVKNGFHIPLYDKETTFFVNKLLKSGAIKTSQLRAHLKIETGTNRLGIKPKEIKSLQIPPLTGVYTHLAESENIKSNFYKKQLAEFKIAQNILRGKNIVPKFTHVSCTATIIQHGALGGNLVRPGIGLYGLWPTEELKKNFSSKINLKPVLSWKTRLAQIKELREGETVGYERTHKIKNVTAIGIIPVGYYDGLDRKLSNTGTVLVNGKVAPIIGRVCMNMTMIGLGGISARKGGEVVLIGRDDGSAGPSTPSSGPRGSPHGKNEISADDIAKKIGTINYEVVSRISPLIKRVVK